MLPLFVFLVIALVALGIIGAVIKGLLVLTAVAAIFLVLTIAIGAWTLSRRRSHL
jgi:hypothetical protein